MKIAAVIFVFVMPGLVPGISILRAMRRLDECDGRDKPSHDEGRDHNAVKRTL
jgi:hypothetical protein